MRSINLDATAKELHDNAVEKGFWEHNKSDTNIIFYLKQLAMVHSEVSEVLEAIRKEQGAEKIVEEFADILIRVLDLYWGMTRDGALRTEEGYNVSLHDMFEQKIDINRDRPRMHGVLA
jgi:NTP pyrophosphatase (non-canonical NTP hydrolase)